jgi:outer membrane protein OmpA-like peptidoglycan-associated protein
MTRRLTIWAACCALALAGSLGAQETPANGEPCTVQEEDVKTWTTTIDEKEWSVRPATPSYEGDTGLFHLSSAYTLPKGSAAVSLFRDNLDRDPKDIDASIHGISFGFGATERLEVFGSIGLQTRIDVDALSQAGFVNEFPLAGTQSSSPGWQSGVGDVRIGAKFKLLDDYLGDGVGLALKGHAKLPTADDAKGLGTGKPSFGADLVLSKTLNQSADIHASVGYQVNSDPDGLDIGNALKWGVGVNLPACRFFQLQAELTGKSYSGGEFDGQTNPVDLVLGPVFWIKPGLFIRPAISMNLSFDDRGLGSSSKSYTGRQISIGYHPGTPCCEIYVPPPPPPPPPNRPTKVACEADHDTMLPGETVRCRAKGSDPDGDPLSYSWTASAGSVVGSGAEATFDSAGVAAPATITVTVTASDGRGGTAEATCTLMVEKPPAPEPITCTSGGFPRNLSRLNNVDKACLDDVASRLAQDPRSRVVIVGHADSKERYPEVIGRTRAEAVKAYLVTERGVDETRISTSSAAATKPIDTGTTAAARAKNRRVEVIFLAEGAKAPEEDD